MSAQNLIFETPSKVKNTLVVSVTICWNNISHNANDFYEAFSRLQTKETVSKQIWPEDVCSKHADVCRQQGVDNETDVALTMTANRRQNDCVNLLILVFCIYPSVQLRRLTSAAAWWRTHSHTENVICSLKCTRGWLIEWVIGLLLKVTQYTTGVLQMNLCVSKL